ncbi:MAG: hypothetical protein A2X86_03105 [Bdellovibrionales bacterium GWA2_49_15]|nr:MAG: hypothetical protein A2X86_03105 [Bdellovibrionales bacterium GWA2_49_15]HAZ12202.1 hypothetical protein [Bdellovibrionales bacterium]
MNTKICPFLLLLFFTGACAGIAERNQQRIEIVLARATFDLDCPKRELKVTSLDGGPEYPASMFGVSGCNQRATYLYDLNSGTALLNSPKEIKSEEL